MKKLLLQATLTLSVLLLSVACKNDDLQDLPDLRTDFCDITLVGGRVTTAAFDDGRVLDFHAQGVTANVNDTVLRYVLTYTVNSVPRIYNHTPVLVCPPEPIDSVLTQRKDPIHIGSAWIGGKYLNLTLGQMTTRKEPHPYAVSADTLLGRTLHMTLHHAQPKNDPMSYTDRVYASIPLDNNCYNRADYDSIVLRINTFDGERPFIFSLK